MSAKSERPANARSDQANWPNPSSCATSLNAASNAFSENRRRGFRTRLFRGMVRRTGPFDGERNGNPFHPSLRTILGNGELTFLGHPFESFGRAFDPVLAIVPVGRKQPDHLVGATGGRTSDIAGRKIDSLSNVVIMLQRPLHHAETSAPPTVPLALTD